MSLWYEMTLPIDSRDVDGKGVCKASALLGHLQEAATQAAEHGGFSREVITREHGAFWMLTRVWYRLERPLRWEEELTIRTWHRGGRAATLYRDYDLYVGREPVGECVSAWVLARQSDRQLLRLSAIRELDNTGGGALCKDKKLSKLRLPDGLREADRRRTRYSDTDINGHVNNTRYADFACDALEMEKLEAGTFLSQLQIGYLAECRPGEELRLMAGQEGETRFVRGMDEDGKSRFEAALIFSKELPRQRGDGRGTIKYHTSSCDVLFYMGPRPRGRKEKEL